MYDVLIFMGFIWGIGAMFTRGWIYREPLTRDDKIGSFLGCVFAWPWILGLDIREAINS